jgi:hypothetical protein
VKITGVSCRDLEIDLDLRPFPHSASRAESLPEVDRLADQEKLGRPWSDDEIDAIIADYLAMLGDEIAGRSYVKSHHSAVLMRQIGRTHPLCGIQTSEYFGCARRTRTALDSGLQAEAELSAGAAGRH